MILNCIINNYNPVLLKAWLANIDLQPVYNYYKEVSYMTAYFSKSERKFDIESNEASRSRN